MKYCCDCAYMETYQGEGKNEGKFPCTNKKVKANYVSAREKASSCNGFLECFSTRGEGLRKNCMDISKEHGYYVVTAVNKILRSEDSNMAMQAFEYLRDYYMPNYPRFQSFIEEYDSIGPKVAEALENDEDCLSYASYLYFSHLTPMANYTIYQNYDAACETFIRMFSDMKIRYGISYDPKHI